MGKRGKTVSEEKRREIIKLRRTYSVSYIAKHLNLSKSVIYKILRQERKRPQHFSELSTTTSRLIEILDWYYKQHRFTIDPFISSDFPYTTHTPESPALNERELSNLLAHLKDELPELIPIAEYSKVCERWFALSDGKGEKQTPSVTITSDLILKLKLRANRTNFVGKCPDCPR